MARKTSDALRQKSLKASRIDQTLKSIGWPDVMAIIQEKYDDCMNRLLDKENPEARGGIQAITEIMNDISAELQFGENARKKYNEQYLNIKRPDAE